MKMTRACLVLVPVVALLGMVACGGSSSSSGSGGAGGKAQNTGGKTSAGGTSATGSGGVTGNGGNTGGPRNCGPTGSGNGTCTTAETDAYSMCLLTACDSQNQTCLGPDYKNGNYTGVCGTYFQCRDKCACGDSACVTACPAPSAQCTTCLLGLLSCSSTCTPPACYGNTGGMSGGLGGISGGLGGIFGGFGGITGGLGGIFGGLGGIGGGATCADLLACCNKASGTSKQICMTTYTSAMASGDQACALGLAGIKSLTCP